MSQKRFILLDRDGTLIEEKNYLRDPDQVRLYPQTAIGLRKLQAAGFGLIIITNQSGLGRGYFTEIQLKGVHQKLSDLLSAESISLDGIYYCSHTPEEKCDCRKPEPGLVREAAMDFGFDPKSCLVVGDKPCDIDLGRCIGAKTFLVKTGYGQKFASDKSVKADYIVENLLEMAHVVVPQTYPEFQKEKF